MKREKLQVAEILTKATEVAWRYHAAPIMDGIRCEVCDRTFISSAVNVTAVAESVTHNFDLCFAHKSFVDLWQQRKDKDFRRRVLGLDF